MEDDAQALLRNHRMMESRLSVIRAKLEKAEAFQARLAEEKIQDMSLARQPPDGLPTGGGQGSQTEYIALHYREQIQKEQRQCELEITRLRTELVEVEGNIALYAAVMKSLSEVEGILVRLHYDEGLSFSRIAELDALPNDPGLHSVSTLKRMNNHILRKVDKALSPLPTYSRIIGLQ